jgi:hypothetical protein
VEFTGGTPPGEGTCTEGATTRIELREWSARRCCYSPFDMRFEQLTSGPGLLQRLGYAALKHGDRREHYVTAPTFPT